MRHVRILARDPLTTRSENFSLLCYPAWGDPPFLRDLDALSYDNVPMSTPGLRRTRLLHPDYSDTLLHTPILTPHYPDRNVSVTSWRHPTRHFYICESFNLFWLWSSSITYVVSRHRIFEESMSRAIVWHLHIFPREDSGKFSNGSGKPNRLNDFSWSAHILW